MLYRKLIFLAFVFLSFNLIGQIELTEIIEPDPYLKVQVDNQKIYRDAASVRNIIELPFHQIGYSKFTKKEVSFLSEDFMNKRPDIRVYKITSLDNPNIKGRLMTSKKGTYATILTDKGLTSIYPLEESYILEQGVNIAEKGHEQCTHHNLAEEQSEWEKILSTFTIPRVDLSNGTTLKRFRLAIACTGEFYALNGNNDADVEDIIVAAVQGLNVIFENELAVQFTLLTPFLYDNKNTDPFIPNDDEDRPDQASVGINMAFPNVSSYDIGHVFHRSESGDGWGSGGIARLSSVCRDQVQSGGPIKAKGWSGSFNTSGNGFIALAAHEFAHMYSATHTFNGTGGSCTDNISSSTAYEIGSGTTIMSYQGICDADQNIPSSGALDNYFHVHSLSQMITFLNTQASCANSIPINNTPPVVNPNQCGGSVAIPKNTPFFLKGNAGDQENTNITYTWEQYDEDGDDVPTQGFIGSMASNSNIAPLFRSFPPSSDPGRYFPDLASLAVNANNDPFQALPNRARTLHFQLTARDNNESGGGIGSAELDVQVQNNGPLSAQNINNITAGTEFSFAWSTNNTEDLCTTAKVLLSIDGGLTYPFTVAEGLDYASGSTQINLSPSFPNTDQGRLMIVCDDQECYSFFDISNNDINISSSCNAGGTGICDTEYEVFDQGDAALDLDLDVFNGEPISNLQTTITDDILTRIPLVVFNEDQSGCHEFPNMLFSSSTTLRVDEAGSYSFSVDLGSSGGTEIMTIHEADTYSTTNPCPSFVGSNSRLSSSGGFSSSSSFSVELEACKEYRMNLIVNTSDFPVSPEVLAINGPGNIFRIDETAPVEYSNTFIAVNDEGIIEVVSATSDFTSLSGGEYSIYGVNYKSGGATPPDNTDPTSWIGQQLTTIQANNCMLLSSNKKDILVDFSCRILSIEVGNQSDCEVNSNLYSQEIIVTYELPPLSGNLIVNGIAFPITASPQTVTLMGQISDGMMASVNASFSEIPGCALFVADIYTAPENCCEIAFDLGGDRAVCDDQPIILDAGDDGVSYTWFRNGDLSTNDSSTFEVTESGNYIVTVINDVGCEKTEVVNIVIFDTPAIALGEDRSSCEGEIFSLQSDNNAQSVQWYKDDAILDGETDGSLLITEAGTYVLIGSNTNQLSDGSEMICSSSDTIVIDYVTRPEVELGEDKEFCENDPAYILNAGQDGTEYTWARNTVVLPLETTDMLEVTESGTYTVIVDKGGGCDAKDTVNISFIEDAEVFAGQDINVCIGLTNNLASFINADTYEWYYEGQLYIDQSENPEVTQGGDYVLVGYNSIGCEVRDTVNVNAISPPVINLGEDKVGCIGSPVLLTVDSIGTVVWRHDNSFFSSNATIEITEPGNYEVTVLAATDCGGSDDINVTFEPGPSLELGMNTGFCEGENFTIEADTDGDNITWFKDGVEIMGENDFLLTVTEEGLYSANVAGGTGCTVEDEIEIVVNEVPNLQLADDPVVCDGESAILTTDEPADTYSWEFNGSEISTQPEITVTEAGVYTLTVINQFGCSDSDEIEVIANERPALSLQEAYNICEGESIDIIAEGNGDSFQWIVDGTALLGETSNTISLSEAAMVEVIASSPEGCTSMASTSVFAAPSPEVELGENTALCPGQTLELDAGDHNQYLWSDNTDESTLTVISIDPPELTTELYSVTVTNDQGCTAEDQVEVQLFPAVQGEVTLSASGVCNGEPVQLVASGGTMYQWVEDATGTLTNIDGPNALASPTETTTYQVIVSDECPGNEDPVIIQIEVFEAGDDIDAGEDDCAVNGKTVDLNASGGASYNWVSDPTIVSGADTANPTVSPTEETIYFVDITDDNGCIFRDSVTICVLDDPLEFFKLVTIITPNGDGDNDALRFEGLDAFPENTLTIYNRWGYPVYEKKGYQIDDQLWTGEEAGDVLPADTYYYILSFNDQVYKSSITIMR